MHSQRTTGTLYAKTKVPPPPFSTLIFQDFSMPKKMKIHDLLAQRIIPSKRYTTYECIPELVVTVPVRIGQ